MKIIFASANAHKASEIRSMLPEGLELLSLEDVGVTEEIPETADTIEGNAILKTEWLVQRFQLPCFSDDTGLIVPALNGEPGVYSARYAGPQRNSSNNMQLLLQKLENHTDRAAWFQTSIALWWNNGMHIFEGRCEGAITEAPRGENGFGYDPVFQPSGYAETFAELDPETKNRLSHRGIAFRKMISFLGDRPNP